MWAFLLLLQAAPASQPLGNPLLSLDVGEPVVSQTLDQALAEGVALRRGGLGTRGILTDVKHTLQEHIIPERSHGEFVAFAKQLLNDAEATTKPRPSDNIYLDASPGQRGEVHAPQGQMGYTQQKGSMCFGHCGQKHEVFRLTAVLHIEHDDKGVPKTWKLKVKSPSETFNQQVLDQVAFLVKLTPPPNEPIPVWSEWNIHAIQYKWGLVERAMDPIFKPKSLVTQIELRAVKYAN